MHNSLTLSVLTFFYLLLGFDRLPAEVDFVTVNWSPIKCQKTCISLLLKEFHKVPGITDVNINPAEGVAHISWKKGVPFSLLNVKTAMRLVGISYKNIRIKVRGSIRHNKNDFYLISDGDNASYQLVNPVIPDPLRQAPQYNQYARQISPDLQKQLLEAEKEHKIAVIEGPFFMPERSPDLVLTVEKISFQDPVNK